MRHRSFDAFRQKLDWSLTARSVVAACERARQVAYDAGRRLVGDAGDYVIREIQEANMSIHQYLRLIRRHIAVLVLLPLLFAAGGSGAESQPKVYGATAHVLLRPNDPNERVGTGGERDGAAQRRSHSAAQADIARGPAVLRQAAASLTNTTERELQQVVTVTVISNANLLYISADDETPDRSVALANGVATAFIENRRLAAVSGLERAINDMERKLETVQADLVRLFNPNPDVPNSAEFSTAQAQFQSLSVQLTQLSIDKN